MTWPEIDRRSFLRAAGMAAATPALAGILAACSENRAAAGKGKPRPVRIGFIALTDCASVLMAKELGYFDELGLDVEVVKQASWPVTRDNLLSGQIDAAHCLFSMPASMAAGIGGKPDRLLKIAMVLNTNGQAITLNKSLAAAGYGDPAAVRPALRHLGEATFAMTFPGGTHDTWLRYWLLAGGIEMDEVKIVPIPPPQMVANMRVGNMHGFCVGEPWNAQAVHEGIGFTAITTQDIWEHHPEKALVVNPGFATSRREDLKAVMRAILRASKWLDDLSNIPEAAKTVGVPGYIGTTAEVIEGRLTGRYDLGAGLPRKTYPETYMRFYRDGMVNAPRRAHLMWFLAQYRRFGYLSQDPPFREIADRVIVPDLYDEVAEMEGVPVPDDDLAPFEVRLDGAEFDPRAPHKEAKRHARATA